MKKNQFFPKYCSFLSLKFLTSIIFLSCFILHTTNSYSIAFAKDTTPLKTEEKYLNIDIKKINEEIQEERYKYQNSLEVEKYKYEIWTLSHTKKIYEYQHTSSVILLGASITILVCGLYFSYIQFQDRTKINEINPEKKLDVNKNDRIANEEISKTSLKIGMAGIEISSSIIGLLILCVSLAFFYLYIANVYPIFNYSNNKQMKFPLQIIEEPTNKSE